MSCPTVDLPAVFEVAGREWRVTSCLWPIIDPVADLLSAILRFDSSNILPAGGGWFDQSEFFLEAWEFYHAELSSYGKESR